MTSQTIQSRTFSKKKQSSFRYTPATLENPRPVDQPALEQFTTLDQQTSQYSVSMTAFEIPEFNEENGDVFTQFVTYWITLMDNKFAEEAGEDTAKAFLLLSNTTGVARS